MSPIQQMLLGVGAVATKTFVDDVFSTYIYNANQNNYINVNNGIDLAGEGGLVWGKRRDYTEDHVLCDTERGPLKYLSTASTSAPTTSHGFSAYNSNGFTVNNASRGAVNQSNGVYCTWTFRKAPGFFDVVTYTGNSTAYRAIDHQLGCVPGMLIVKRTDTTGDWQVLHRKHYGTTSNYSSLKLNSTAAEYDSWSEFNRTNPTATQFTVSNDPSVNATGGTYVCYLFAGGESTAATARSVDFDGNDYLSIADHSDFTFGTDDFTLECWYKADSLSLSNNWSYIFSAGWPVQFAHTNVGGSGSRFTFYMKDTAGSTGSYFVTNLHTGNSSVAAGQWYHVAVTRSGSTFRIFLNGELKNTATSSGSAPAPAEDTQIGRFAGGVDSYYAEGEISNLRLVKGTAVYTSSFRPPYEPLTNITNTKLLCCNNSSTTGSTVTPGTITAHNSPTASTDSPFDDPAGFVFGDAGDQNVIKCGSYVGNGSSDGQSIFLGFEPQFIIQKNASANTGGTWNMYDSMRGVVTGGNDRYFRANTNQTAGDADLIEFTPTGFNVIGNASNNNGSGVEFIYIAIRRSDGYCGKPPELGNQAFTPVFGSANAPLFKASNHVVDFTLQKNSNFATQSADWNLTSRLTSGKLLKTNSFDAESSNQYQVFDYQSGTSSFTGGSGIRFGWLWKRNAGMDVICYEGTHVNNLNVSHSLNAVPEMMIIKNREAQENWAVYHKGLNGGTNPQNYFIWLNSDGPETDHHEWWNDTAPTSTHFTVGTHESVNPSQQSMIAMLFRSVSGISAVGSYSGSGSTGNSQNIGFQPRFLIIRRASVKSNGTGDDWFVFDSVNGFDKYLILNKNQQRYSQTYVNVSSTGFSLVSDYASTNESGANYIYYAHA